MRAGSPESVASPLHNLLAAKFPVEDDKAIDAKPATSGENIGNRAIESQDNVSVFQVDFLDSQKAAFQGKRRILRRIFVVV